MKTKTNCTRVLNDVYQRLLFLLVLMALLASSRANTLVWTGGGGVNGNWNASANWGSAGIPGNGDTVVFQGVSGLNSTNNIANLTLNQMRFISGGFNIFGSPFTLTNSLVATNFTGSINVYNTMTNGTADLFFLISNSITVTLYGNLNGPVGVKKAGSGTLTYNGPGDNSYTGTTLVSAGTLQLNVFGVNAFLGPLVIGDGSGNGSPTVRNLQNQDIPDFGQVTVNLNGLYDLNNFFETIGTLTIQGGTVNSEAGTLTLNGNITILGSSVEPIIFGNLSFNTMATIAIQSAPYYPNTYIEANLYDNGHGLVFTNLMANDIPNPQLDGSNTITGPFMIYNTWLNDGSGKSLGATNPVTITTGQLALHSSNYTNKSLTIQGNNSFLDSIGNCTWAGPIVLVGNQGIYSYDNGPLNLAGPISGTGNLTVQTFDTNFVMVLSGSQANTFAGDFYMEVGTLELDKSVFDGAIPHNLIMGWNDGGTTYSATNRNLLSNQINNSGTVTLSYGSIMDVNNNVETIGALVLNNGSTTSGTGTLFMAPNGTITAQNGGGGINGNFNTGSGTLTLQGSGGITFWNSVSGSANIVQNDVGTTWYGNNSYSGTVTVNGIGIFDIHNSYALGNVTNTMTLNGSSVVALQGSVNLTNKTVTFNNTNTYITYYGSLYVYDWPTGGTNSWHSSFVLDANCIATAESNCVLNLAGPISGPGGVTKVHAGTFIYSGSTANTYTGLTTVNQGELDLAKSSGAAIAPFQAGMVVGDGTNPVSVVYRNGNQIFSVVTPVVVNYNALLNLNGFSDVISPLTLNSGVVNTAGGQLGLNQVNSTGLSYIYGTVLPEPLTVTNSGNLYIYANILPYSTLGFTLAGGGATVLTASNSFNGPTVVQQGYLILQNNSALGTTNFPAVVDNFATLELGGGTYVTNKPLVLNGAGAASNYGALDVESGINVWAGPVTNNGASTLDAWYPGSELHINGPISGPGSLELFATPGGGGTHFFEGSAANTYAGLTTVDTGTTLSLNKSVFNVTIPGNLVVNNGGTARLGNSLQLHTNMDVLVNGGGLLDMGVNWDQIDTLHGSGTLNFGVNGYLEVGWNNGTSEFDGPLTGTGYTFGGYTVAKFGTGAFTMTGNSTFTSGAFHVKGGSLFENGLAPQVPAIVDAGTTFGGTGTVNTITANGFIAPGDNGTGILTCTSNLVFSSTGHYMVDLSGPNPGSGYDQIKVAGTNGLANAGLNLNVELTSPVGVGQQFVIVNNSGAAAINGIFSSFPEGSIISANGYSLKLSYVGGTGSKNVVLTVLSVPGSAVSSAVSSGDGSHGIDPNGCNNFNLVISNKTSFAMNNVSATLSTTTEGVIITQPYATYSNIPGNGTGTNITPFQISALPSFVCGTPIALQLGVKSSSGAFTVNYTLNSGEVAVVPSRYDISGNVAIPDVGTVDSTNFVSGFASTPIQKVVVSMYVTHPFDSDLTNISLISPDGTTVLLSSANGGSGQNYGSGLTPDSLRTTFDDAAATSITAGSAPFVGSFRPQSPLSAFAGNYTANGNWHLHFADGFGGSLGTLRGWSLFLYGSSCNTGSGPCDYCMTAISGIVTNTSLIQTNRIAMNAIPASCGAPKAWPGGIDLLARHYDIYAFTNTTVADACVTAVLISSGNLQGAIYLNSFNPSNIQTNYLGDSGSSTVGNLNNPQSCSATIPAGAVFYVTVNEVTPNTGGGYILQLSGLPCPPPTLNIQPVAGNKARLYWDTSGGGYVLESVSNLTANAWGGVTNEPIVSGGKYNVTNSTALPATNGFYRLHMP